jgi:hypothetical protein
MSASFRPSFMIALAIAMASSSGLGAPTPAPAVESREQQPKPRPPAGEPVSGISCDAMEGQRLHTHQHLVILDRGKEVPIPPNVGQPLVRRCIYWVHTHTPDGIIHIEAPLDRTFTLGDFFDVWGEPLTRTTAAGAHAPKGRRLKVWVNDKPYTGDPRAIALTPHADIVIEAGPPFPKPPRFTTWGRL